MENICSGPNFLYSLFKIDRTFKSVLLPENIPLEILYEDNDLAVINKEAGMGVHPGSGNHSGTLANALIYHFKSLSDINNNRPGIVHRLDKETSGLIIIAKSDKSHLHLAKQFSDRTVKKKYKAIVWGKMPEKGKIEGLIGRHPGNRKSFKMVKNLGRHSLTNFITEDYIAPFSYVSLYPSTGRTHQIRVHLNSIGHPILLDSMYGGGKKMSKSFHVKYNKTFKRLFNVINRVSLHAEEIEFLHPTNLKSIQFKAPLPADISKSLELLRNA